MADFNTLTKEQAEANRLFATANIGLNRVDSYDPAGSITWSLRPGADPSNPQVGDYVQKTTLNPSQQAQFDSRNDIQQKLLALAQARMGEFASTFGQPMDTSGLRAFGAPIRTASRLNPQPQAMTPQASAYSALPVQAAPAMRSIPDVRQLTDPSMYRAPPVMPVGPMAAQPPAYSAIGNLGGAGYGGSSGASTGTGGMGLNGAFGNAIGFKGADAASGGLKGFATKGPIGGIVGLLNGVTMNRGVFNGNLEAETAAAYNAAMNAQNTQNAFDSVGAVGGGGFGYGGGWGDAGDGGMGLSSGGVGGGGYADGSGPGFGFGFGRGRGGGGGYGMGGGGGYGGFGGGYGNGGGGM